MQPNTIEATKKIKLEMLNKQLKAENEISRGYEPWGLQTWRATYTLFFLESQKEHSENQENFELAPIAG